MKHIKKSFLFKSNLKDKDSPFKALDFKDIKENFDEKTLNKNKNLIAVFKTDRESAFPGIIHKVNGKTYIFPIPDPTLIYFHNAQGLLREIKLTKNKLLKNLDLENPLSEAVIHDFFEFYGKLVVL